MKLRIVMPLVLSAAALTGCQQLNDGVNTVNGAISSSLSSVGKALGGTATTQSLGPVSSVSGLGAVCKDYEENAMAAEKKWTGIGITNEEAISTARRLMEEEGILAGISSGAAVAAALKLQEDEAFTNKNIVVILPSSGERYLSTALFADLFTEKELQQ